MSEHRGGKLIPERVMLVGEGGIPRDVLDSLEDNQLKAFLRVSDPAEWPPGMEHMVQYLKTEERTRIALAEVFRECEDLLRPALERWADSVWEGVIKRHAGAGENPSLVAEEALKYARDLIERVMRDR